MFSFGRTLEILLFAFCNFGPYVILSYYIFRKYQRCVIKKHSPNEKCFFTNPTYSIPFKAPNACSKKTF